MDIFQDTTLLQYLALLFGGVVIGISKTGLQGLATLAVPIMAMAFGAKPSTGVILPMLCIADLFGVIYYRRSVEWRYILRLLPASIAGLFLALLVDKSVLPNNFNLLMAGCVGVGLFALLMSDKTKEQICNKWWFAPIFGLLGGFTTMIGNAAGPVMMIYLLSMRLSKMSFVGTSAIFFLIINYIKIPIQIYAWDNIDSSTLALGLVSLPFIALGAYIGVYTTKRLSESRFRTIIITLTIVSVIMILFS